MSAHKNRVRKVARRAKLTRTTRLSVRVDPRLLEVARRTTGIADDSDLVNAALAMLVGIDDFGPWFATQAGRLLTDFELEL
jgi:hypothetical protein